MEIVYFMVQDRLTFESLMRAIIDRELSGMSVRSDLKTREKSVKRRLTARIAQHHDCFIVLTRSM